MSKKSIIAREKKRRDLVARSYEKRQALKRAIKDLSLSEEEREAARMKLSKMKRDSSPVRLNNRCRITGRSHAYLRKFQVSRIVFRELAGMGIIPGITKASW